jgi:hypothetical protein
MKFRISALLAIAAFAVVVLACSLLPAQAQFSQQGPKLVGTNAIGPASQGRSVSISHDGNTAITGGYGDNGEAGAAWVFTRSGVGVWSQQAKLVGTDAIGAALQGISVALSGDGESAIVGGYADNNLAGAAWVYTRSSAGVWSQQAKLVGTDAIGNAFQGFSVSISSDGNTAIVGALDDNSGAGAAWVFTRLGTLWSQQAKLVGTGAIGNAQQGSSVSLSGDGNTAIVGGPDDAGTGAAWVFTRSDAGVWRQQAKLVGTGVVGFAVQGVSVSLSGDGNTAIVGGPDDNNFAGAAWVFSRSGGLWSQQGAKLVGTGAIGIFVEQGGSVSLSDDGNTAIVGGQGDNGNTGLGVGAAWLYTRSGGLWNQQGAKLVGTGNVGNSGQGAAVAIASDGNTAIVGGPGDSNGAGAVWVYSQPVFAGTPGNANCYGRSVSALALQYGGLNAAAAASGFSGVGALQNAILTFCGA